MKIKRHVILAGTIALLGWFAFEGRNHKIFDRLGSARIQQSLTEMWNKMQPIISYQSQDVADARKVNSGQPSAIKQDGTGKTILSRIFQSIWGKTITILFGSGGLIYLYFRFFLSESSATRAARRKFTEKITSEISNLARTHYWSLANYSGIVAGQLETYLNRRTQLLLISWNTVEDLKNQINKESMSCADETFWGLCQLLLYFDEFQFRGSNTYLLTSRASGELARKLYNAFMVALLQTDNKIESLKIIEVLNRNYDSTTAIIIDSKHKGEATEQHKDGHQVAKLRIADLPSSAFMTAVEEGSIPLKRELNQFRQWICEKGGSVEEAAQALRAYCELLTLELELLHDDWFSRKHKHRKWPTNAISIDSVETLNRVRYKTVFLIPMTREAKRQPEEKDKPQERKTDGDGSARQQGGSKWPYSDVDDDLPSTSPQQNILEPVKRYISDLFDRIITGPGSYIKLHRSYASFSIWFSDKFGAYREQASVIELVQLLSTYATAVDAYMNEDADKFLTLAQDIQSRLPKSSFAAQRAAMVLSALSGHVYHQKFDSEKAAIALRQSERTSLKLYRRIAAMKEDSCDRRVLPEYATYRAILCRELAMEYLAQGKFRKADHLLDEAIRLEPEWSDLFVIKFGTQKLRQAKRLIAEDKKESKKDKEKIKEETIKLYDQSYNELIKRGLQNAAGVSAFEKAIFFRDRGDSKDAFNSFITSLRCFEDTEDDLSKAVIHQRIAELFDDDKRTGAYKEAVNHYHTSAEFYQKAKKFIYSAETYMLAGDLLVAQDCLAEAAKSYEDGFKQTMELNKQNTDDFPVIYKLRSRQALLDLVDRDNNKCKDRFHALIRRWSEAGEDANISGWGPHYEALSQAEPILKNRIVRNAVKIHYHFLLREHTDLESARDLTAAILKLYDYERDEHEADNKNIGLIPDSAQSYEMLNVNSPLAIEVSETATEYNDESIKAHAEPIRNAISRKFGVRIPGIRVRPNYDLKAEEYILMIHEIPVARDSGTIDNAFYHLERILEENLVEFLGHQEVQNFLERSLLVKPTIEDIAEKEHYSHIDILSVVLRALVLERVPLARPGYPLLTTDISNPESLLNKLRNKSDAVSEFIVDRLSPQTQKLLADYIGEKDEAEKKLLTILVDDLNVILERQKIYDEQRFKKVQFRESTKQVMKQEEGIRDEQLFNCMLLEDVYSTELLPNALIYRNLIYETFRSGWKDGIALWKIVENIRCIPEVLINLWGNQLTYHHVLLPPLIEQFIESRVHWEASLPTLVLEPEQVDSFINGIVGQLSCKDKLVLIVRQQEHRPLLRSLIAHRLPEVPVLSLNERRADGPPISSIGVFPISGVNL